VLVTHPVQSGGRAFARPPLLLVLLALACATCAQTPEPVPPAPRACTEREVNLDAPTDLGVSARSILQNTLYSRTFKRSGPVEVLGPAEAASCLDEAQEVAVEVQASGARTISCTSESPAPVVSMPLEVRVTIGDCMVLSGAGSAVAQSATDVEVAAHGTLVDAKAGDRVSLLGRFADDRASIDLKAWPARSNEHWFKASYFWRRGP